MFNRWFIIAYGVLYIKRPLMADRTTYRNQLTVHLNQKFCCSLSYFDVPFLKDCHKNVLCCRELGKVFDNVALYSKAPMSLLLIFVISFFEDDKQFWIFFSFFCYFILNLIIWSLIYCFSSSSFWIYFLVHWIMVKIWGSLVTLIYS